MASRRFAPEQALLAAVLESAVLDIARPGPDADAARAWLLGADVGGTGFTFVDLCDHLRLEPRVVRALVRRMIAQREHRAAA